MTDAFSDEVDEDYKEWFDSNIISSYFDGKYPWTRLGYTYDWADNGSEYGLSEFIIKKDSDVKVAYTVDLKEMLDKLEIQPKQKLRQMSKGTREKVQLILTMSRQAKLYLLDEPIGGVDPAARDYILDTIIRNYDPEAAVILSTHLIADVERILDEVIFVNQGQVLFQSTVDAIREEKGKSVDALFREVYKC